MPVTYEPETEEYLEHADVNILNDDTIYFNGTAYEITGAEIWTALDLFVVTIKGVFGLALGSLTLRNQFQFIYPRIGGTAAAHTVNLVDVTEFQGTFFGGWTHDGSGALPNGTNAYMETGCNYSTVNFSQNDQSFGVLSKTNVDGTYSDFGALHGVDAEVNMYGRTGAGAMNTRLGDNGVNSPTATADSLGYLNISRESAPEYKQYKNSTLIATITSASVPLNTPSPTGIIEAALASGGTQIQHSPRKRTFFDAGLKKTGAQVTGYYNAMIALETTLNR